MGKLKLLLVGYRHPHITMLHKHAEEAADVELVGICEEDAATRKEFEAKVRFTHDNFAKALAEVACDAVGIGDYFARRGVLAIQALRAGKHVIADKPLCVTLEELDEIEKLSKKTGLKVGCMLDVRGNGRFIKARELILSGAIGEVHAIAFGGQHPLSLGSRPKWYFEPGKHGGTINDIGVHAFDYIPWMTGARFETVNAARGWNAFAGDYPHFQDAGQFMLTMSNGCGVLGDVSYFSPDKAGYSLPQYWRTTFWGRKGVIELNVSSPSVTLIDNEVKGPQQIAPVACEPSNYLRCFIKDIQGETRPGDLDTAAVFVASRVSLLIQNAADTGKTNVSLK